MLSNLDNPLYKTILGYLIRSQRIHIIILIKYCPTLLFMCAGHASGLDNTYLEKTI